MEGIVTQLPRRVFVAGATGAIGRVLCRLLQQDGWQVTGATRKADRAQLLAASGVEPVVVDVFDADALHLAVMRAQPSVVIHQLTDLPERLDPANRATALARNARLREIGTMNLVDASVAAGAEHLVAQSIAFAYAPGSQPFTEDAPLDLLAVDPVVARTVNAVNVLESLVLTAPLRGVVLRYGELYGPHTWNAIPAAGGAVHVEAAAHAARLAATRGEPGVYNIAEPNGRVSIVKATRALGWDPKFRIDVV